MKAFFTAAALSLISSMALAQTSPAGLWKTIDDDGKTEKSLVRIVVNNGQLTGTVEKIFEVAKQDGKCDKCTDDRKDKPVQGMQIIRGVRQDADDKAVWSGGQILDPNDGKSYRTKLQLIDGGKKLEVRGYILFFSRAQTWLRVE